MTYIPFTYLLGWSKLNKWYYGVRYSKNTNPDDLWKKYFSSSKIVHEYRKKYGDPDIIEIRKIFTTAKQARYWEERVLKKLNVIHNDKWLNLCINSPPIMFGPCSYERRQHISNARINTIKIKCLYCHKSYDPGNFKQYHDKNCKYNPNQNKEQIKLLSNRAKRSVEKQKTNGTYSPPKKFIGLFVCPHCNKNGINYGNMHLHHFNNCKKNPDSPWYNIKRPQNMKKMCCLNCKKETNSGNFFLYHFKKDFQKFHCSPSHSNYQCY